MEMGSTKARRYERWGDTSVKGGVLCCGCGSGRRIRDSPTRNASAKLCQGCGSGSIAFQVVSKVRGKAATRPGCSSREGEEEHYKKKDTHRNLILRERILLHGTFGYLKADLVSNKPHSNGNREKRPFQKGSESATRRKNWGDDVAGGSEWGPSTRKSRGLTRTACPKKSQETVLNGIE